MRAAATAGDFDSFTLDKTLIRPWGPGIMSEIVFYLVKHLNCQSVTTIGWDLEKPGETKSNHFYGERHLINKAALMEPTEAEDNINASLKIKDWLSDSNIDMFIGSERSYAHSKIERKSL